MANMNVAQREMVGVILAIDISGGALKGATSNKTYSLF